MEQTMNVQPDAQLTEAIESLRVSLSGQTTLIYVLMAIAALSLIIALIALNRGRGGQTEAAPAAVVSAMPTALAQNDGAVVAAITAAISCLLAEEKGAQSSGAASGFVVRRIRRV